MKKAISLIISIVVIFSSMFSVSAVYDETDYKSVDVFKDELVNLLNNNNSSNDIDIIREAAFDNENTRIIVKSSEILPDLNSISYIKGYRDLHILDFENYEDANNAIEYYEELNYVEYAEFDGVLKETTIDEGVLVESAVNNYPTSVQSDLFGYTNARNNSSVNYNVEIAVIDSGVQSDHDFLQNRVEPTGFNSVTSGGTCYDDRGHGTQVAGVIVANTKSNVTVKPYKVLNKYGEGSVSQVVLGIDAAIEDGVNIINLSMTMQGINETLHEAIQRAWVNGIIVVVAAGNSGDDLSTTSYSPACFEEVISVMSCSNERRLSTFSNYGTPADYAAPGEDVLSPTINNQYKISSGTSLAAPFICAAVAYELGKFVNQSETVVREVFNTKTKFCYGTGSAKCLYPDTSITPSPKTASPVFSIASCSFIGNLTIELSCSTDGADIYYTTDSSVYNEYTGPIVLDSTKTVTAFAVCNGKYNSSSVSVKYTCVTGSADDYIVDENNTLVKYTGTKTSVTVPSFVNNVPIYSVGEGVFSETPGVTSVTFERTMLTIGDRAFADCADLTSVQALGATSVGERAFNNCIKLTTVKLSAVTAVGAYAFNNCGALKSLSIPNVTQIGEYSFNGMTSLTSFTATKLSAVPDYAFENCGITSFSLSAVTEIGDYAFCGCQKLKTATLSKLITLGDFAFNDCISLTSFSAANVTGIGDSAFSGCSVLASFAVASVQRLGAYTLEDCASLKTLTFNNATTVGEYCFSGCNQLHTLTIKLIETLNLNILTGCTELTTLTFDSITTIITNGTIFTDYTQKLTSFSANSLTSIQDNLFKDCTLLSTVQLSSVKTIGENSFENTALTDISFSRLETIEDRAFAGLTSLKSISLPALKSFTVSSFEVNPGVTSVNMGVEYFPENFLFYEYFPNVGDVAAYNLIKIPSNMFKNCVNLDRTHFDCVEYVGANAFDGCKTFWEADLPSAVSIGDNAFNGTDLADLILNSLVNYNPNMYGDSESIVLFVYIPSVKDLKGETFEDATILRRVNIDGVEKIPDNCFKGLTDFTRIDAENAKTIGNNTFNGCIALSDVYIPDVTNIGDSAFYGCTALTEVDCTKVVTIGNSAFRETGINDFYYDFVETVGDYAFYNTEIFNFNFLNVKSIGDYAFYNTMLSVVSSESITEIGEGSFEDCLDLQVVSLPAISEVSDKAFKGCKYLEGVEFGTLTSIGNESFMNINWNGPFPFEATADGIDVGDRAFYNSDFILEYEYFACKIRSWGSQAFYGGSFFADANSNDQLPETISEFPLLKYVSEEAFDGLEMIGTFIFENVETLNDLPDECTALVGSDCITSTITDTPATIYSPKGTYISQHCLDNNLNYIELNEKTAIQTDVNEPVKEKESLSFSALGFNTTYSWYGANKEDLSDKTILKSGDKYKPLTSLDNIDESYKYYFCVAQSTENGNILNIRSTVSKNIYKSVVNKTNESYINFSKRLVVTDCTDSEKVLDSLSVEYDYTEIKPSHIAGDYKSYGTGTVFEVYHNAILEYSLELVMNGDVNGDGYVDALDCYTINMASTGVKTINQENEALTFNAADSNGDNLIDVNDYQAAVNKMCS